MGQSIIYKNMVCLVALLVWSKLHTSSTLRLCELGQGHFASLGFGGLLYKRT